MLFKLKSILKTLALNIHFARKELKEYQKNHGGSDGGKYYEIGRMSHNYRHKHIAYCLLRGTPMERIETKPKYPDKKTYVAPDETLIKEIMNGYKEIPQNVCAGS